ncbi:MAG: hypothetical protein LBC44_01290 [Mycoplasmataceae bacterium]|jgi:hypothetical protein|nr:hypothetical protein [Mycoplasmataceae bacterium]
MGKIRLYDVIGKVTQHPAENNGNIIKFREMEKVPVKGKGGDESLKDILLKFIDEQRAVNVEQKKFNSEVKEFIVEQKAVNTEQKKFNSEVKEFIVEQKVVNKQQAEFNARIEAKVNETSEKLERVIELNKLKS